MAELGDVAFVLLMSGFLLLIGVGLMRKAFRLRKQRNLVRETPTEDVESVSLGQSELQGTARPGEAGTITAPFSDEECLVAEWRVEEYRVTEDSDGNEDGSWHRKAHGVEHVPFYVDDGTGQLLVRPDERVIYEITEDEEERIEVGVNQSPSSAIREFEKRNGIEVASGNESHGGHREGDRRYFQNLIQPGEQTYVFGVVQLRDDRRSSVNQENLVVQRVPEGDEDLEDMFMIGDRPESEIVADRRYAMLYFPAGALITTAGVGVLIVGGLALLGISFV